MEAIEQDIRMTSLYGTEITDILVKAAKRGGELMRKMKNDVFIAMLDSVNDNAFPNMESYIGSIALSVNGKCKKRNVCILLCINLETNF